jgi:hypothetical protein
VCRVGRGDDIEKYWSKGAKFQSHEPGTVAHTCNLSTGEMKGRESEVQG